MSFVSGEGTISSDTTNILTPFTMNVDGTDYNIGDSFIIDGKIAKISEIN